jgi:hypothetical protein
MTGFESEDATPAFACRVEMAWSATDGSVPEAISVTWEGEMPSSGLLCQTIRQMAESGSRPLMPIPTPRLDPDGFDKCARPTCGHYRRSHRDADFAPAGWSGGRCKICEESTPCPGFVTEAELLQEG